MDRRQFLANTVCAVVASVAARPLAALAEGAAPASAQSQKLAIVERTIEVNGKATKMFGLVRPDGGRGLVLDAGGAFDVALTNASSEPTLIHWHGLTPPWAMDGVPDNPAPAMAPGESRRYLFPVGPGGTHWMHAHTLQEQRLLAAPLIVRTAEDRKRDEQEVVMLLHDFAFAPPEALLAKLQGGGMRAMNYGAMGGMMQGMMRQMAGQPSPAEVDTMKRHLAMMREMQAGDGNAMPGMGMMDLNDIDFDAYLANDRTLDDPEIVRVEKGGRVRLRVINGATATAFTLDLGALAGEVVAVDGQPIAPIAAAKLPIAMGQRVDIRLALPAEGGAFPVLALREGGVERTGIVLASPGATVARLPAAGAEKSGPVEAGFEAKLRAASPLAARPVDRRVALTLTGDMQAYSWAIGGGEGLAVKPGERVEATLINMSMMSHPMHLHGHHFQVVELNGERFAGAVRDTLLLAPMASATVIFDADNAGRWPFHCHNLYHMASGMMAFVAYPGLG